EIRGGEALDLIQAMTSGHGGCLSTLHATYPKDTLTRLETMAMMSDVSMPLLALRVQIGSAVDIIVQMARLADGSRKVTHISEVEGFAHSTDNYVVRDLWLREYSMEDNEAPSDRLVPTGIVPACSTRIRERGYELPEAMLEAQHQRERSHD